MNRGSSVRFAVAAALILATVVLLQARSRREIIPPRQAFATFPLQLGEWQGRELRIAPDVLEVLGPGDFTTRAYFRPGGPYIDLFLAYFPSQRSNKAIHSPKNCLPGSGWLPSESGFLQLTGPDGRVLTVNRYIIAKGLDRQLVLYWYQAHNRVVASEYWAKYYLVADAMTMNRSDGALVRVVTPIASSEPAAAAEKRAVEFAQTLLPKLDAYIPR